MSEVNGNKSKNKKKKNGKQSDVTCWNCFTTEGSDSDTVDVEPITLPKVREEHREKLKVYSFLASELSKPKAVSLKQKISEPYKIGKKIDAEILKQQSLDPKNVEKECNSVNHNIESCQGILDEKNISVSVTTDKKYDQVQNIEKDEPKNKLKDFPEKKIYNNFPQKVSTHNVTNLKSITPPQEEISILQINKPKINNDTNENTHCILETANQNKPLSQDSLLNSKEQFSNQQLQKPEKCDYSNGKIRDDQRRSFEQTTPTTVFKLKELEKFTPLLTNKVIEKTSVEKSSEELSPYKEILSKTSISLSNISNLNKPFQKINFTDKFVEKKAVTVPCELPKITPIKFRNINADLKIPVLKQSPAAVFTETTIKDNSTVRSKDLNEEKSVSTKNIGEISIKREGTNENTYQDKILLENNDKDFTDSNKIVHKVQILTSTPKEKCTVVNKTPLEDVIAKSELNLSETKEEIALNSDKIDNASSNGSESGYTGSLATVQEFVIDESQEECIKNENIEKGVKDTNKDLTSSLYSLNTVNKKPPTHSSSFSTGINNVGKKPIKSLRWSTLSMVPRSVSFEDEVYMSEAVSPGHATLPRRSNSPLPHEREMDRDRFPINRSGLQARSESMASVYSGAGEGLRGSVTVKGEVQFSLLYNYRLGALEVGVKRCRDLAPVDVKRNRSDPYVKVYLLPDKSKAGKRKTKVKKNTLNPVFEETLSFVQPLASLSARTLWLSAWHADMFGRNDFLGEVTLPLADVVFDDPAPMWYKLHERTEQFDEQQGSRGDLIVGLKFELADAARGKGTLHVLVKEAKNLVATKPNGLADVFCKSYLLPERGRLAKQKTTVVRRSLNPRWEHTFTYRGLTLQELATRALELSLWDRDRLASNDFMGAVRLSLATGTYMGASVNWMDSVGKEITLWQNMMQQPNLWVEGSLPLRPQLIN